MRRGATPSIVDLWDLPGDATLDMQAAAASSNATQVSGPRQCRVFEKWRKKWNGPQVEIALGTKPYCAVVDSWTTCLELCRDEKAGDFLETFCRCSYVFHSFSRDFGPKWGHERCVRSRNWLHMLKSRAHPGQECAQVVFVNGHCCGMNEANDEDQDGLGGTNYGFLSAQCVDLEA